MARLCPPGKLRRALDLLEEDFARGLAALEGLARTYAKDPAVRAALGTAYLDDDRPFEALPHLEWAERKDPVPEVRDALLETYLALDMPHHANRLAARSGRVRPGDAPPAGPAARDADLSTEDRLAFERARTGAFYGDPTAAPTLERLLTKHPGYQPARNMLVTDQLLQGDLEAYVAAAGEAFALAPDDPHALLNAVRAALLEGGVEGACALRRHVEALEPDPGWGGDRYLARVGAWALMDDADAAEAAMAAYHDWVDTTGDEAQAVLADALDDLLERRVHDPRAPLVDLAELVMGLPRRWERQGAERILANVEASLAAMPGVVRELPDRIGYQAESTVRFLALALLHGGAAYAPHGAWPAVLERVARYGPGTLEARQALWSLLVETGHIPDDAAIPTDLAAADDEEDDDDDVRPEVPDLDELATLPVLEERWCVAVRPATFMIGREPEPTLTWLGAIADGDGLVRVATFEGEPFDTDALYALVARACIGAMTEAEPARPRFVIVEDVELVALLAERLAPVGIEVVEGDIEPALVAMHGMAEALGTGTPAWLAEVEDETVQGFFDAVVAFYEAEPWRSFHSERFLAYRVGDGPWRYVQVMGQAAQEYGLAVYPGWDEAQAFVEDRGEDEDSAAERLAEVGWLEGLSLTAIGALSPLDAGRYLISGMEPDLDDSVPAWLRFEADGPAVPEHGPGVYAVLVALVADHARRARKQVRRIDATAATPAGPLRVVYPATGDEAVGGGGGSGASEP
ncbi:MAG: hypothetical protein P1P87_02870 [Trueperaceae bacterium]|nr:hypothetical protein [Trueperaceae bacterium]